MDTRTGDAIRGVYLILDPEQTAGRPVEVVAEAALCGGVRLVQWRQKSGWWNARWTEIQRVHELCRRHGAPFLINDRVDVALALGADGVHLGQDDLPLAAGRRLLPRGIVGVSTGEVTQVQPAVDGGADYLGVGPMYATRSKANARPPRGPALVVEIRAATDLPLVAIGGITAENAVAVRAAGADALAVIAAIGSAPDVEAAAHALVEVMEQ